MKPAKTRNIKNVKAPIGNKISVSAIILVLGFVFILPLIYFKSTIDPVVYPRFTFIALLLVVLTFFISPKNIYQAFQMKGLFRVFLFVFFAFLLISILSLFFAINPVEGLTDILKWILFFVLVLYAYSIFISEPASKTLLFKAIAVNALIAFVIGVYQFLNLNFTDQDPNLVYEVTGLMAHKNQYSFSLFLLLPFLAGGVLSLKKSWKTLSIIALSSTIIMLVMLQTRAVWIGIFFSGFILLPVLLIINRKKQLINLRNKIVKRIIFLLSAVFVILILVVFLGPEKWPTGKIKSRITSVVDPEFTSNVWRIEMWQATLDLIEDHPLAGVGAGNWKIEIYPYYSKYLPSVYRHWRNPHNDYLQVFAEKGIFGLLLFIGVLLLVLIKGFTLLFSLRDKNLIWQMAFFLFVLIVFYVILFFSFPTERPNQLVFLAIAIACVFSFDQQQVKKELSKPKENFAFSIPVSIVLLLIFVFNYKCTSSEINIAKAQDAKERGNYREVKKYAEKGYFKFAPFEPKFSFPVVMYRGLGSFHSDRDYKEALRFFDIAHRQHPTSVSVLNNMGTVYGQIGDTERSIEYFEKSLEIFPHYEFGLINLAKAYYVNKDYEMAYKTVLKCDPRSENAEINQVRQAIENKLH